MQRVVKLFGHKFSSVVGSQGFDFHASLIFHLGLYWKQLENKQEMKASRFMKWNNYIKRRLQRLYASNATITKL
jgi:hypothetical protein